MLESNIEKSWRAKLKDEFQKEYFQRLESFLKNEKDVFPPEELIFEAFNQTSYNNVKVVILGQDPYHGEEQAHGLSFSVPDGVKIPPSLKNIFKVLKSDIGVTNESSGNLTNWAKQGVLLLNATLTVRAKTPGSHQKKGWEEFTDAVIKRLSKERENLVFLLWGNYAQKKGEVIDQSKHLVLKSTHPSPFSAHQGFLTCNHFSKTNEYLSAKGKIRIDWQL